MEHKGGLIMDDWEASIPKFRNDIGEYLIKRYEDYCNYIDEREGHMSFDREEVVERHKNKKNELIKFGKVLRERLEGFLPESRKELFENTIKDDRTTAEFFKSKYKEFKGKFDKEYRYKWNLERSKEYSSKKFTKKLYFLKMCETMKNNRFIENIDERKVITERRMFEEDKRIAEEKIIRELSERRQGHSNIKPLSFYEEFFDYGEVDVEYKNERIEEEQEYDVYYQENGTPEGVWVECSWCGDYAFPLDIKDTYISHDNSEDNLKYINKCKELGNLLISLKDSRYSQYTLHQINVLEKYLNEGYLITRQITNIIGGIEYYLKRQLTVDPNNPDKHINNHPSLDYNFNIYTDDYDITKIKEDVSEFIRVNEEKIFTPYECLVIYLEKHDNRITIKEYAKFAHITEKVAKRILYNFVEEGKLKWKKEGKNHQYIFSI